jgi:transcriptional regulator of acetoin/glycerol metabolism
MSHATPRTLSAPTTLERRFSRALRATKPVKLKQAVRALRRTLVRDALARNTREGLWNVSAAARELGIGRNTLYDVLKKM